MRLVRCLGGIVSTALLLVGRSIPLAAQYADSVLAQLSRLSARAAAVDVAIERAKLTLRYCSDPDRDDAGRVLASIQLEVDDLQREYTAIVAGAVQTAKTQLGTDSAFRAHGMNAANQASWAPYQAKIVRGPAASIAAAMKTWNASRVVNCDGQPSTTPPAPMQPHDSLGGLTRVVARKFREPPVPTGRFCDSSEVYNWYREHLKPVMDSITDNMRELNQYGFALHDLRYHGAPASDWPALERASNAESAAHDSLAKKWNVWRAMRDSAFKLIGVDCPKTSVAPAPTAPADKESPAPRPPVPPKGGWKIAKYFAGPTVDYAHYVGFSDVAKGTSATSTYEGKQSAVGVGLVLGAEADNWRISADYHFHSFDIRQRETKPVLGVSNIAGRLKASFSTMTVGRRFCGPRLFLMPYYGIAFAYDELTLGEAIDAIAAGRPLIQFAPRKLHSWKNAFGGEASLALPYKLEAGLQSRYITAYRPHDGDRVWWMSMFLSRTF